MISFSQGLIENKRHQALASVMALFFITTGLPLFATLAHWFYIVLTAIVVMRQSLVEAKQMLVFALLWGVSLLLAVDFSDQASLFYFVILSWFSWGAAAVAANSYRNTQGWESPVYWITGIGVGLLVVLHGLFPSLDESLRIFLVSLMPEPLHAEFGQPGSLLYAYFLASVLVVELMKLALLLVFARFVQSKCYYPEGFALEWQGSGLQKIYYQVILCVSAVTLFLLSTSDPSTWGQYSLEVLLVLCLPGAVDTILMWHRAMAKQQGYPFFILYYGVVILLLPAFYPLFFMISLVRRFFNLRNT